MPEAGPGHVGETRPSRSRSTTEKMIEGPHAKRRLISSSGTGTARRDEPRGDAEAFDGRLLRALDSGLAGTPEIVRTAKQTKALCVSDVCTPGCHVREQI
jgi:hypothetical protein